MTEPADMKVYSGDAKNYSVADWADRQGYVVKFVHAPTRHKVEFPALISDFTDTHSPSFGQTLGSSMHDPILTLEKTDRAISFTMTIVSASVKEARYNAQCVNLLIQMLYPTVSEEGHFIGKPFINIHMMNLLEGSRADMGVTCVIQGLDYGVKFDEGVINGNEGVRALNLSGKEIYPRSLEISISAMAVIEIERREGDANPFPTNYPSYGGQ
tara:strand:+ start:778 stop:1416 length:639 start_codon:yes stop_codon:yes gene_type:complete